MFKTIYLIYIDRHYYIKVDTYLKILYKKSMIIVNLGNLIYSGESAASADFGKLEC